MKAFTLATVTLLIACSGVAVIDGVAGGGGSPASPSSSGITSATSSSSAGGFDACNGPGQCALTYPGCCYSCDVPSLDTLVPVAKSQAEAFHAQQCPRPMDCPLCEASCPNGNLFSFCDEGRCQAADMRTLELSACTSSSECTLRISTACCEPCVEVEAPLCSELIAISNTGLSALNDLVCPEDGAACPPCAPTYPDDAVSECIEGHCQVTVLE